MKHKKFEKPKSGEWVQPKPRGYLMSCCDCGLVHRMNFKAIDELGFEVTNGRVQFQVFRAPKYTASQRKRRGIKMLK